jgi:ParB/RepB/Spo0J family partition protein
MPKAFSARTPTRPRQAAITEAKEQIHQARFGPQLLLGVDQIAPNPHNPRREFDDESLNQLAVSMQRDGQLQPVVVRRVGDSFQLICGERRWRAAKRANIDTIAAIERDASDQQAYKLALVENLHREDLSHDEKVTALDQLAELVHVSGLRKTAGELGISHAWLSRRLSMRQDPVIFPALESGKIGFSQANELLGAPAVARRTLLDRVLRHTAPKDTIRQWVKDAKREIRNSQQSAVAVVAQADGRAMSTASSSPFAALVAQLKVLGKPVTESDTTAVEELASLARQLLEPIRRRAVRPKSIARPGLALVEPLRDA